MVFRLFQSKTHNYGVVVGIRKLRVHVFNRHDFDVLTVKKPVHYYGEIALFVRNVAVAARWDKLVVVYRARYVVSVEYVRGQRLRPPERIAFDAVEFLRGIARKIMIEISAANAIIAFFVLCFHVVQQHTELSLTYFVAAAVRRKMNVVQHKFFAVVQRNARYRIATVEVEKFTETCGYGQTSSRSSVRFILGIGVNSAVGFAVRLI